MQTRYPPFVTTLLDSDVTTLRTGLLGLVEGFAAERRTAEAVLVTAALGPAAVATAAVALVALLMVHRRRRAVTLVRGRGASVAQLLGSHLVEGLLIAAPAAALAYAGRNRARRRASHRLESGRGGAGRGGRDARARAHRHAAGHGAAARRRARGTEPGTGQPAPDRVRGAGDRPRRRWRIPAAPARRGGRQRGGRPGGRGSAAGRGSGAHRPGRWPADRSVLSGSAACRGLVRRGLARHGGGVRPATRGTHRRRRQPAARGAAGDRGDRRIQLHDLRDRRAWPGGGRVAGGRRRPCHHTGHATVPVGLRRRDAARRGGRGTDARRPCHPRRPRWMRGSRCTRSRLLPTRPSLPAPWPIRGCPAS